MAHMGRPLIRSKRAKISAGLIISLPLRARQALDIDAFACLRVSVAVVNNSIKLKPGKGEGESRVFPKVQMSLPSFNQVRRGKSGWKGPKRNTLL